VLNQHRPKQKNERKPDYKVVSEISPMVGCAVFTPNEKLDRRIIEIDFKNKKGYKVFLHLKT
jgi:hypothetical protein